MSINPITVTRIKTVSLMGHSNADGWGNTESLFEDFPHLIPGTSDPSAKPLAAFWKNIYVATSAQPYPGTLGTPTASNIGDVEWLEMTVANTAEPTDDHPHPSPYQFPNNAGVCYPHYYFNAYSEAGVPLLHVTPNDPTSTTRGVRHGIEIPLMWAWKHYWQNQVGLIKLAISSTLLMAHEPGSSASDWLDGFAHSQFTPTDPLYVRSAVYTNATYTPSDPDYKGEPYTFNAWWTPGDQFDWAPHTDRLYKKWIDKITGAAAALPSGSKIDVQLVVPWFGDNESLVRPREALEDGFKNTWVNLIKRIRADLIANDWTTLTEREIPIIIPKVFYAYTGPDDSATFSSVQYCNGILAEIAKQDPFVVIVDSHAWSTVLQDDGNLVGVAAGSGAGSHIGSNGYVAAAKSVMDAWESCRGEAYDALRDEETITVGQAIDKIRIYYSKSRENTDMNREVILQHLNGAMNHVVNHVGDNAWWLTRRKSLTITSGQTTLTTLPSYVHRLLMIEDPRDPTYPVTFEQVGHAQGGKLQIRVTERATGSHMCHYITHPKELTQDSQVVPAPRNISEWIIVETCRRMAASSSNIALVAHFSGESMQLQSDSMRNMGQVQRSKRDVMRTQRRRPNLRYGGRGRSRWANDS